MKYKLSEEVERKLEQFNRSNYAELLRLILTERENQLNKAFRSSLPEGFSQVQGRALEIDDLLTTLRIKA